MVSRTIYNDCKGVDGQTVRRQYIDAVPGMLGGMARVLVGQPFDTVKNYVQMEPKKYKNTTECLREILTKDGIKGLYRGMPFPLMGNIALLGVHFPMYDYSNKHLNNHYVSGAIAGAAGSFISCPTEHIRVRLQNISSRHLYSGSFDCAYQLGLARIYKGFIPTLCRDIHGYGAFFYGYKKTLELSRSYNTSYPDIVNVTLAGVVAGLCLWSMFPIDTIKTKIQADSFEHPKYKSMMECYRRHKHELWNGYSAVLYRAIPVNIAICLTVEYSRQFLNRFGQDVI